jgi:haloacetate dehalogenase
MANDLVKVMATLGYEKFFVGAHDRGARVAHRLGMDHANRVIAMTLLDIAPTREMYANTSFQFASGYWHWFFLIQPNPLPEIIIGQDPTSFWKQKCFNQAGGTNPFRSEALDEYLETFSDPQAIRASCEDYRAAASIDIEHDDADESRRLSVPLQVFWAKNGTVGKSFDPMSLWEKRAESVIGGPLDATHYMAEEFPAEIADRFSAFFEIHRTQFQEPGQ